MSSLLVRDALQTQSQRPHEDAASEAAVKHDKSEQTDISPDDFELDDCLLESNDIVITQNKDGFVLHVKKLGNITTAKIAGADDEQSMGEAAITGQAQITDVQDMGEVKPTLTTLTTSQTIKLPSSECELINLKKIIPATTTIAHHPHHTTIIQPHQLQQHQQQTQQQQQQQQHHHIQIHDPHQQHTHEVQQQQHHIVTTSHHPQTINVIGMRNVQITEQKPMLSRIKYSRGKIITQQGGSTPTVQIVEAHEHPDQLDQQQHHELTDGTKYEISEIDLNNAQTSAAIISDLVKYAEIDDIELPDGTKIGIGFAPTEIAEHMEHQQTTQLEGVEHIHEQQQQDHHLDQQQHHQLQLTATQTHLISQHQQQQQQQQQHHQVQTLDQDDETIIPDSITVQEYPSITKSYTILTTRPMKQDLQAGGTTTTTTTYELSLSDSSMGQSDDIESKYVCRHCGKKYRWKSTLRRHENVECGGKEPCHPCPHCSYKAKQRGNLGVHVRKHHPDKPQLESKRGRKI